MSATDLSSNPSQTYSHRTLGPVAQKVESARHLEIQTQQWHYITCTAFQKNIYLFGCDGSYLRCMESNSLTRIEPRRRVLATGPPGKSLPEHSVGQSKSKRPDAGEGGNRLQSLRGVGFPGGTVVKNLPANAGDTGDGGSISESGRSPGEGNDYPLHCSCLGNPMDRGAWWATAHGVTRVRHNLATDNNKGKAKQNIPKNVCFHVEKLPP